MIWVDVLAKDICPLEEKRGMKGSGRGEGSLHIDF